MDRVQELCESPGLPVPNSPYGLCGRQATCNLNTQWTVTAQRVSCIGEIKRREGRGGGRSGGFQNSNAHAEITDPSMIIQWTVLAQWYASEENSKTLILKDSSIRSKFYLTASPCNTTNTDKHKRERETETETDRQTETQRHRQTELTNGAVVRFEDVSSRKQGYVPYIYSHARRELQQATRVYVVVNV